MDHKIRCSWCESHPLYVRYHDEEWGVAVHDDRQLFEMLVLDGAQAGLSWLTVLKKRDNYRRAFDEFDVKKVAAYTEDKISELLLDEGIIRNKLKIRSAVTNAQAFLRVQQEFGSFDAYIWQFTGNQTKINRVQNLSDIPARSPESDAMSKDLISRGFKFVGSTICYAFMQAAGMINDHVDNCWRKNAE